MPCPLTTRRARRARHLPVMAGAGLAAVLGCLSAPASADDITDLQREVREMQRHYDAELKRLQTDYESRIRHLETRLKAAETKTATRQPPPAKAERPTAPPPAAADAGPAPGPVASASAPPPPPSSSPPPAPEPTGAAAPAAGAGGGFNPAIGVILQGKAAAFSQNPDTYRVRGFALGDESSPGTRGLSLDETEVNFQANADPYLFGNLTLSIEPDNQLSIEEAFIQSTSLPAGFTLRAGRFFSGIGYLNEQHSHTWDFADQALPYRVFLNTQYDDDGVQLRWLAPTTQFLEFGSELFRGAAFPAGGPARVGFGSNSLFVHTGNDINESSSYRTGLSWLHATSSNRLTATPNGPDDSFYGKNDTLIFDAVYKWAPNGNPVDTNFKLQGEFFANHLNGQFDNAPYAGWQTGFYAQAVYQFMPRWRVGLRYDQVSGNRQTGLLIGSTVDSEGITPRRGSAMIEYNTSEFGRFRLQYNLDWSRGTPDNQAILQYIISLGAHGAHIF